MRSENPGKICNSSTICSKATVNKQLGFTLLELIILLGLISILSGIWILPAYQKSLQNTRLEAKARALLATLQFARITAMQHATKVSVCQSHDQQSCGGKAQNGWIVLAHSENAKTGQVLQIHPPLYPQQSLAFYGARRLDRAQFQPNGTSYGYSGRFVLCAKGSKIAWFIFISHTGRVRLTSSYELSQCAPFIS